MKTHEDKLFMIQFKTNRNNQKRTLTIIFNQTLPEMLHYLLQTQVAWLFFYGLYAVSLSRETFFRLNRVYLLTALLLGLLLPFIPSVMDFSTIKTPPLLSPVVGATTEWTPVFEANTEGVTWTIEKIILGIYSLGFAVALGRFLTGLFQIYQLYRHGEQEDWDGCRLVYTEGVHLPFSFFRWIFINPQMIEFADYQQIMTHEQAHVRQRHSLDVVFVSLVGIVFWWSPLVYFYKKSLRNVHEYLADAAVLSAVTLPDYGDLLLRQADQKAAFPLANHFIFSQLKKRFLMMTRTPSAAFATAKYVFAAPIIALLLLAFANPIKQVSATAMAQLTPVAAAISTTILPENTPKMPVLPTNQPILLPTTVVTETLNLPAAQPSELQITKLQTTNADTLKPEQRLTDEQIKKYKIDTTDKPPQAQPGHCYAKCKISGKTDDYSEWKEIVCGDKVTDKFMKSLHRALREKGYETGEDGKLTTEMKKALTDFQRKNSVPVGNLNYETLKVLMSDFKEYEVVGPQKNSNK